MAKTNTGLVAYAKAQLGRPYWYGCFGQTSTTALYKAKKGQYPEQYQWACPSNQLGIKVHDCVGLIKGYLWCATNEGSPTYNSKQDVSANGMLSVCKEKGAIGSMPDIPGILVFMPHHVGVYIGNGYVIEAKGHAYGVVKTTLKGRGWTNWGKCPYIDYVAESKPTVAPKAEQKPTTPSKPAASTTASTPTYAVGKVYTLKVDLNVRTGAGTKYAQKKKSQLTADGQKHALNQTMAVLKAGTKVTVEKVIKDGSDIWVKIPSGYVAAFYSGKKYIG